MILSCDNQNSTLHASSGIRPFPLSAEIVAGRGVYSFQTAMNQEVKFNISDRYCVTYNDGVVKITSNTPHKKGGEMGQWMHQGWLYCKLFNNARAIHDIVATYFIGVKPAGMVVNHKNGIKTDNRWENLEYVTISENIKHAKRIGLHVSCDVTKMPTYKDGRCLDRKKYKHDWYVANKERLAAKMKQRYQQNKDSK